MVFVIMGSQLDKTYQAWKQVWNKPEAFRALVEKSVSGIMLVNDKYTIEHVNERVCTILGCIVHCMLYKVGHRSLVRPENGTGLLREEPLQVCHIPQRSMLYWSI